MFTETERVMRLMVRHGDNNIIGIHDAAWIADRLVQAERDRIAEYVADLAARRNPDIASNSISRRAVFTNEGRRDVTAEVRIRCGCVWLGVHCGDEATAEDGLCDWCSPQGARTEEQLRQGTSALISSAGTFHGLGGRGQVHDVTLADLNEFRPSACWYEESGRTIVPPTFLTIEGDT